MPKEVMPEKQFEIVNLMLRKQIEQPHGKILKWARWELEESLKLKKVTLAKRLELLKKPKTPRFIILKKNRYYLPQNWNKKQYWIALIKHFQLYKRCKKDKDFLNTFESEFKSLLSAASYKDMEYEDANDICYAFVKLQEEFKRKEFLKKTKHSREYLKISKEVEEFFTLFTNYKISETTLAVLEEDKKGVENRLKNFIEHFKEVSPSLVSIVEDGFSKDFFRLNDYKLNCWKNHKKDFEKELKSKQQNFDVLCNQKRNRRMKQILLAMESLHKTMDANTGLKVSSTEPYGIPTMFLPEPKEHFDRKHMLLSRPRLPSKLPDERLTSKLTGSR